MDFSNTRRKRPRVRIIPINLQEKFRLINDYWNPKIVGELNGQHVKLVKIKGDFVFHKHDNEDELFLVIEGNFTMEYRDKVQKISAGEFVIVPRGVEHRPVAENEALVLLFESATTLNTGNVVNELTKIDLDKI